MLTRRPVKYRVCHWRSCDAQYPDTYTNDGAAAMPGLGLIFGPWGKLGAAALVVVALYGWHRVEVHRADRAGYARAIADIEKANAAAGRAADGASGRVGECYAAGGTWNRETGKCDKP